MKLALKISSWILAIIGVIAMLRCVFGQWDAADFGIGLFLAAHGALANIFIKKAEKLNPAPSRVPVAAMAPR